MAVEHVAPALVRDLADRLMLARRRASEETPESRADADDARYWQRVFEANAAAVLGALTRVQLAPDHVVRYRYYGRRSSDFLVRPFVVRHGTDVSAILRLLDWHPPPDASHGERSSEPDVELLYRHFQFEPSPAGVFEYWVAIQELWASQRWIHSTIIADAEQFAELTAGADWEVERPVERVEPAVVHDAEVNQIAVLLYCPVERHNITFHRIRVLPDRSIEFAESILVAHGPRGYLA